MLAYIEHVGQHVVKSTSLCYVTLKEAASLKSICIYTGSRYAKNWPHWPAWPLVVTWRSPTILSIIKHYTLYQRQVECDYEVMTGKAD